MIFLIDYDRGRGHIVSLSSFPDSELRKAEDSRLAVELTLNQAGIQREVVLLDAADEEALRRTHRRYFVDVEELLRSVKEAAA
jgi:hypothetical protein